MNYTKGEWKATDDGYVFAGEKYVHEPNNLGFEIKQGGVIPQEVLANARLIAAAPDMYLAIQHFLNHNDDGGQPCAICLKRFNKAIAKAEASK